MHAARSSAGQTPLIQHSLSARLPVAPSLRDRQSAGLRNVAMPAVHIVDPKREQIAPALPSLHSNYGLCAPQVGEQQRTKCYAASPVTSSNRPVFPKQASAACTLIHACPIDPPAVQNETIALPDAKTKCASA